MTLSDLVKAARDAGLVTEEKIYLDHDIPDTVEGFYQALGCPFTDSKTGDTITELAPYQRRTIHNHKRHRKLLVLKSQKIGLSSLGIVMTLWHALTDCQGYEIVVLAQSRDKAIQHGRDIRKFLARSRFKDYLITGRHEAAGLLRDETTKQMDIYIHNRKDLSTPTQIHILSPSATQIASLKRVKMAWCSDITLVKEVAERQQTYFMALMSRLILTEGPVFIECPTVGHLGPIWEIDDNFQKRREAGEELGEHEFFVDRIKVWEAVDAGLMSKEAVEALRKEHGVMFAAFFEADWFAGDSVWYNKELLSNMGNYETELCNL